MRSTTCSGISRRLRFGTGALALAAVAVAAQAQQPVMLDGSSGMMPLARALAKSYREQAPDAVIETGKGLGTGARLRALAEGRIQVALASHGIDPEEVRKRNLRVIEIARGAIVFAVNESVPIADVTEAQVCDIFSGRAATWKAVGGPDRPIAAFTRPPNEVDPEVIREKIACFRALEQPDSVKVMAHGGEMARALAETPHAVGMTSMTVVEQSAGRVKALRLNGVEATPENVKSGRYPLSRQFFFVVAGEAPPEVEKFIAFVLSPAGERVIRANGAIPMR
jgi:phosphate transport system substrate-binding protein